MGAIPMIVSAIAQKADVKVVWGHFRTASTNGKQICMPMLPLEDVKVEAYVLGYAVHETGHIVGSNFGVFANPKYQGISRSILNILEDVRIEAERMKTLPGARRWLESLTDVLVEDQRLTVATDDASLPEKLAKYLLLYVYYEVLRYPSLMDMAAHSRSMLQQEFPADLFDQIETVALKVKTAQSTEDVCDLVDQLMNLLRDEQQKYQDQAQQSSDQQSDLQGQEGDQDQASDESGDSPQTKADENNADSSGQDTNTPSQDGDDGTQPQSTSDDGSSNQETSKPSTSTKDLQELANALQDLLDADEPESGKDKAEMIVKGLQEALTSDQQGESKSKSPVMSAPEVSVMQQRVDGTGVISQVRTQSMALRARLHEFVQVNSRRRTSAARSGNRMVRDAATRIAMNDYRVFSVQRSQVNVVDTAILLLVDASYSMNDPVDKSSIETQLDVAKKSAVALAVALEQIKGTQLSIVGFGKPAVTRVMQFGEGVRQAAGRMGALRAGGSTPMAEALMVAQADLLACNALRRIVMVITDGDPDDPDAARELVKFGQRNGIEHMGVGINLSTNHLFPLNCRINDVRQLPTAVVGMVQQVLFDNRLAA